MPNLNTVITLDQLLAWNPCYDREMIDNATGGEASATLIEILDYPICLDDKCWVLCRKELFEDEFSRKLGIRILEEITLPELRKVGQWVDEAEYILQCAFAFIAGDISKIQLSNLRNKASELTHASNCHKMMVEQSNPVRWLNRAVYPILSNVAIDGLWYSISDLISFQEAGPIEDKIIQFWKEALS